jgi:calcineurin-like phosphoesterase family protein
VIHFTSDTHYDHANGLLINVGVDQWNYTPVSLDELATMRNI